MPVASGDGPARGPVFADSGLDQAKTGDGVALVNQFGR